MQSKYNDISWSVLYRKWPYNKKIISFSQCFFRAIALSAQEIKRYVFSKREGNAKATRSAFQEWFTFYGIIDWVYGW